MTIGVPLPTYSVVVLDPDDPHRALPLGGIGELGIAGIGLARGYVNRDDLTEKAFIPDFLGLPANPSGRIYRTGDLCRINEQGEIEYHGRIDLQVKIRGYRIELTEIESVLLQVPGIAGAVVDTYEPVPGTVELVGYYSLRTDTAAVDPETIYAVLRDRLPSYMVPAYLEHLDVIPLTTSDKADRKNLPAPSARRASGPAREHVAPVGPTETALAGLLGEVLGLEKVSTDAHLFDDLGANSLLLAQFCAKVRRHPDLAPVSIREVYEHPTVTALAALQPARPAAGTPARTGGPCGTARDAGRRVHPRGVRHRAATPVPRLAGGGGEGAGDRVPVGGGRDRRRRRLPACARLGCGDLLRLRAAADRRPSGCSSGASSRASSPRGAPPTCGSGW